MKQTGSWKLNPKQEFQRPRKPGRPRSFRMRRSLLDDRAQPSGPEASFSQDGFQLQHVIDGFLVALGASCFARADGQIDPAGPPRNIKSLAKQVFAADIQ